ncbi:RNA polymerase sigma factor [Acetivibrio cellulolyticus]|uniref:RNA polymerase sigma factor n=1 Tax=Acetivibrio cellulolyticus TaxID=35830 RepID=UPI0001E2F088|nr:RNA polymerase sigma factor [Acetivibrio cellulolyticus]
MDEANLVKCWQDGNIEAFRTLYEQYSNRALRTAFLITGRMDIAEDAVQDAFIQSNSQIKQLKDAQKFRPWFYRILVRQSWHYSSKEKGKISFDDIDFKAKSDTMHAPELIVRFETKKVLHDAVSKLSTPLRTVMVLYYFNELSIKEISKVLNCFEGTVKSRLHNARKTLQKELEKDEFMSEIYFQEVKGV